MSSSSSSFPRPCTPASGSTSNPCELPWLVGLTTFPLRVFRPGAEFTSLASCLPLRGWVSYQSSQGPSSVASLVRGALARRSRVRFFLREVWSSLRKPVTRPSRYFPRHHPCRQCFMKYRSLFFTGLAFQPIPLTRVRSPNRNCFRRFDRELHLLTTSR